MERQEEAPVWEALLNPGHSSTPSSTAVSTLCDAFQCDALHSADLAHIGPFGSVDRTSDQSKNRRFQKLQHGNLSALFWFAIKKEMLAYRLTSPIQTINKE